MLLTENDVLTIACHIAETMLDGPVDACGDEPLRSDDRLTGCVQIAGAWTGAIVVECSPALARRAASRFFDIGADETSDEDMRDSVAELANMLGGNLKSLLPGPSFLSLPSVTTGDRFDFAVHRTRVVSNVAMSLAGAPLSVAVLEAEADETASAHVNA